MRKKNKMKKEILMSLSQIFILIIGIFAIGYALGSEVRVVKAYDYQTTGTCFYAPNIPGKNLGPYGIYSSQDISPATKKYYDANGKLTKTETVPINNPDKYYRNINKHIWADVYGAYYLAKDKSGQWYYWYIYKNEYDTNNKWTKVSVTEKPVEECTKYFDKKEAEKKGEEPTKSEITDVENTMCDAECVNNRIGFSAGTCKPIGSDCSEIIGMTKVSDIGANYCDKKGVCCCYTLKKEPDVIKDSSMPYPSTADISSTITDLTKKEKKMTDSECDTFCSSEAQGYKKGKCSSTCSGDYSYDAGQLCQSEKQCCCSDKAKTKEEEAEKKKEAGKYKEAPVFGGTEWWGYLVGNVIEGAAWATAVWGGIQALKAVLPEDYHDLADTYANTLFGAILAGKTVTGVLESAFPGMRAVEGGPAIGKAGWIGVGAAALYFLFAFRYESYEVVTFECIPWDAATSTSNEDHCNECNNQGILPCSEYQCRSLGQGCELLNKGTDEEKCAWVNRGDVTFPTIEPWEDALINENYEYEFQNTGISPPDTGVIIQYTQAQPSQCIPAFAPLSFGIKLTNEDGDPEPAKCKLDTTRKDSFDDMRFYFSDGLLLEEHSYTLSMPGTGGEIETENDGEHSIYVRCQDANGNVNTANFVFNFCVQQGPDTTPPLIVQTSIPSGMPIAYNQTSVDLDVYINEPVTDCRWSHQDQGYENMDGEMDCTGGDSETDANNQGLYTCETTLDGLKNRQENKFYFRCEDTSGNINRESYEFILMGTQPLVIDWVKPENESIIKDSTEAVKVTLEVYTSKGYDEGKSNCYFKRSDEGEERYVAFLGDEDYNNYEHTQDLWLRESEEGEPYEYNIKCVDLGGNYKVEMINFEVESDSEPPIIVRAYHEETYLKIITNEPAQCVYDTTYENYPCDYAFDDGTIMTSLEDVNHYTNWNSQETFYIRCQDEYGTQPDPDECSIIVRPSDLY